MLAAGLNGSNVITRIEDISAKGIAEGYRPAGNWIEAQPHWEEGGTVIGGVYTPPIKPTISEIDQDFLNSFMIQEGSVVRALAEIQFLQIKGVIPVNTNITSKQYKDLVELHMRTRP